MTEERHLTPAEQRIMHRAARRSLRIIPNQPPDFVVYVCPRCGARSYHPKDAAARYCGRCHMFEGDEILTEIPSKAR